MTAASGAPSGARVLDASALLAWLRDEPGAEEVEERLAGSLVSTVNLSEVLQKSIAAGVEVMGMAEDLEALGVSFIGFGETEARMAAALWPVTRTLGLSLADRACLATAIGLGLPAVTADGAWAKVEREDLAVEVIR